MEEILIGTTDRTILIFIPDPASTDGSGKTGLVAANLTVSYQRVETDNDVTITDVTSSLNNLSTLTDAHNDWGLLEVSSTLAPGEYRLDVADALFASGAWYAGLYVMITSSAAAATPKLFKLVNFDFFGQSAADLKDFADDGYDPATNKVQGVVLTDTVTTYTGNTPQTGDSFPFADRTVARGTVGATSPGTTSFTPSSLTPAGVDADQFKGRIIIFDRTTTTTALRGQATDITASSAAALPLLTFTALTTAPVSGDTFSVV